MFLKNVISLSIDYLSGELSVTKLDVQGDEEFGG